MKRLFAFAVLAILFSVGAHGQGSMAVPGSPGRAVRAPKSAPSDGQVVRYNATTKQNEYATVSGTYTPPTSTGFAHITSGVPDSSARAVNVSGADITGTLPIANGGSGQTTAAAAIDALNQASEATVASATTTDLGAQASQMVLITGTTPITGFGTVAANTKRWIRFSGVLTLTHNSTSLIIPGASNITTAAGDTAMVISLGSGNWRVWSYTKADGTAVVSSSGSQTPWSSDINGNGKNLTNVLSIDVSNNGIHTNSFITLYGVTDGVGWTWTNNASGSYRASFPASGLSGRAAFYFVGTNVTIGLVTNSLTFALSDMTTSLTTGTNKNYWIPKDACTIRAVRANVSTVSSSGLPTFDVLKNGTSILSTAITIDATERSSDTAATAAVISTSSVAADDYVNFSITTAGTAAAGAQVEVFYTIP